MCSSDLTTSDLLNNVLVLFVMSVTGAIIGWRITGSIVNAIFGYLVVLLFAYAMSWVMAYVGLIVSSPEIVQNASFIVIFPLTFIANTFVPTKKFPTLLKSIANWNPVSAVTEAARELFGDTGAKATVPHTWPLLHPELYSVIWSVVLVLAFLPLCVRRYKNAASR